MLAAYRDGLAEPLAEGRFDLIHSQDCLSANAALELRDAGDRPACDPHRPSRRRLHLALADRVSGPLDPPARRAAVRVRALVDAAAARVRRPRRARRQRRRHPPVPAGARRLRAPRATGRAFGLGDRFTVLTIGGIEPRKGSLTLLEGFARLRELAPELDPLLVVAGGATLFDYRHEVDRFNARLGGARARTRVRVLGSLAGPRDRVAVPGRRCVRVPLDQGGLRAGRARGARVRAAGGGLRRSTSSRRTFRTARTRCWFRSATATRSGAALARLGRYPATARGPASGWPPHRRRSYTWERAAIAHERVYDELLESLHAVGTGRV